MSSESRYTRTIRHARHESAVVTSLTPACTLPAPLTRSLVLLRVADRLFRGAASLAVHPGRAPSRSMHLPPHMPTHHTCTYETAAAICGAVWPLHNTILRRPLCGAVAHRLQHLESQEKGRARNLEKLQTFAFDRFFYRV